MNETILVYHLDGRKETHHIKEAKDYNTRIKHLILLFQLGLAEIYLRDSRGTMNCLGYSSTSLDGMKWEPVNE